MGGWTEADIPDQSGRIVVITGASNGIGLEAAKALAVKGAEVVLAVRDPARGAAAMETIRAARPDAKLRTMSLDLASLASVRSFAAAADAELPRIDLLLNNAGRGMTPTRQLTRDGFELVFGTNHLGHFALTGLVVPALLRAPQPRVVTIASLAHRAGKIDFDDIDMARHYGSGASYNRAKLANLLFARELARRAAAEGSPLMSVAAHPGFALTGIFGASGASKSFAAVAEFAARLMGQGARPGAWPGLYAGTMPDVANGEYWGPGGLAEVRGNPKRAAFAATARDEAVWAQLWQVSEKLTGVSFPSLARAAG